MTQIIAISGRKQSGKSTSCNFVLGYVMSSLGIVRGTFDITEDGRLHITDLFGDEQHEGVFDYFREGKAMDEFKAKYLDKYVKVYSFADILKKDICIGVLGLSYEQVFGTDEQKNSLTKIKWSQCPGVITTPFYNDDLPSEEVIGRLGKYYEKFDGVIYHEEGYMTAREVMQYVGTEIFRRMVPNCWADATIRRIQSDGAAIALICDCRFVNECDAVHDNDGIIIRLTRNSESKDAHLSEIALDDYANFDVIIDNSNMTIAESNQEIYNMLVSLGLVEEIKA